ncbi:MAG: aspartyl protease family protein [Bacteroidia bacterium]
MFAYLKDYKTILIVCFTLISTTYCNAQIILPFEEKGDLIVVKLTIDKLEGQFVFDTGASNTVLDSALAVKLGLEATGSNRSASTSGQATFKYISNYKISITEKDELLCKKIIFSNLTALQELIGTEFIGIIGFDILSNYITKIDYEAKTISLYKQLDKSEIGLYSEIPFNFNNGIPIPQFDISFTLKTGESFKGPILFDNGAALTLSVNTPFKEKNLLANKIGKTIISQGQDLFKKNTSEQASIKSITIGTYTLEQLPITLTSAKAGVSSYSNYLGLLGNKIINRFNIIVDYSRKLIYLKPNKNFNSPFEFPLSGIRFKKIKNEIFIASVAIGSEAEKMGFKGNQRVTAVDGYSGNDMEVIRKLTQQEGKTIKISVLIADGTTKEFNLVLKKLI